MQICVNIIYKGAICCAILVKIKIKIKYFVRNRARFFAELSCKKAKRRLICIILT